LQNALAEKAAEKAGAKPATPCLARIGSAAKSIAFRKLQSPKKFAWWAAMCYASLPQHRKINCTLPNALAEKAAWWAAMCYAGFASKSLLKVRLRCKAGHAEERAAFRSTPPTPLPPLRKINCTLPIAGAQKFPRWAAMCCAGLVH
jgi:hypothetical protein